MSARIFNVAKQPRQKVSTGHNYERGKTTQRETVSQKTRMPKSSYYKLFGAILIDVLS